MHITLCFAKLSRNGARDFRMADLDRFDQIFSGAFLHFQLRRKLQIRFRDCRDVRNMHGMENMQQYAVFTASLKHRQDTPR